MLSIDASSAIAYVAPFLIFFGFWAFLMRRVRPTGTPPGQQALLDKLDEIQDEIRRLRETVEGGGSGFR
jgi:hypothetical protein